MKLFGRKKAKKELIDKIIPGEIITRSFSEVDRDLAELYAKSDLFEVVSYLYPKNSKRNKSQEITYKVTRDQLFRLLDYFKSDIATTKVGDEVFGEFIVSIRPLLIESYQKRLKEGKNSYR